MIARLGFLMLVVLQLAFALTFEIYSTSDCSGTPTTTTSVAEGGCSGGYIVSCSGITTYNTLDCTGAVTATFPAGQCNSFNIVSFKVVGCGGNDAIAYGTGMAQVVGAVGAGALMLAQ